MAKPMPINGDVLRWALKKRGLKSSDVAVALSVSADTVESWIDEGKQPNKGQFTTLNKVLGLTPTFLFLPDPPEPPKHRIEFRRHANAPSDKIPNETAAAVATARNILRIATWLEARASEKLPVVPSAKQNENPEVVAKRLRDWLEWNVEDHSSSKVTDSDAAKAMRSALEQRGIVVLHLTMDEGVSRGFSLHENGTSLIAVNTRDHVRARMFSYAHELVHLALRDDSICLTGVDQGVEGFCNRVAAALLMPEGAFKEFVAKRLHGVVDSRENVVSIRNYFKISLPAAAIRAETLGLNVGDLYSLVVSDSEGKKGGRNVPGMEQTRPRVRVNQYGSGFVTTVLDAEEAGHLKRAQVLDLLRLSNKELAAAKEFAVSGVAG